MNFLQGLHGVVAIVLLTSLLFTEEAGVPLPFAPGELTCLVAGLLIASGGLNPFIFVPRAFVACVAGALVGYSWSRLVGEHGLITLATRINQGPRLIKASGRVRGAGWPRIAVSRLIPGMRIYTTLLAGALGVDRRTFLYAILPATAVWELVFVALGILVGVPIEHFLGQVQRLLLQGVILIVMGVGGYLIIRRAPDAAGGPLVQVPRGFRVVLAVAIDTGVVASVVAGILSVARRLTGMELFASWADGVVIVAAIAVVYLAVTRRGVGATVGEALLKAQYLPRHTSPTGGERTGTAPVPPPSLGQVDVRASAAVARALGNVAHLEILRALIAGEQTGDSLSQATGVAPLEVLYHLGQLTRAGLVVSQATATPARYAVAEQARALAVDLLTMPGPSAGIPSSPSE